MRREVQSIVWREEIVVTGQCLGLTPNSQSASLLPCHYSFVSGPSLDASGATKSPNYRLERNQAPPRANNRRFQSTTPVVRTSTQKSRNQQLAKVEGVSTDSSVSLVGVFICVSGVAPAGRVPESL